MILKPSTFGKISDFLTTGYTFPFRSYIGKRMNRSLTIIRRQAASWAANASQYSRNG